MISYAVARSRASPGLTVSGTSPRAPRSRCWRTLCGMPSTPRTIASACANVVGSATVGPDPMTDGSSGIGPCTSEIASVTVPRRGRGKPSALDLREVLAHAVEPADRHARAHQRRRASHLVLERDAGTGAASNADAPPDSSTTSAASSADRPGAARARAGRRHARGVWRQGGRPRRLRTCGERRGPRARGRRSIPPRIDARVNR